MYLAKLLSPLSKSSYTVSTDELVNMLKNQNVPYDCDLVPFDVTTLFTNVPFEYTIDVVLRKVLKRNSSKLIFKRKRWRNKQKMSTSNLMLKRSSNLTVLPWAPSHRRNFHGWAWKYFERNEWCIKLSNQQRNWRKRCWTQSRSMYSSLRGRKRRIHRSTKSLKSLKDTTWKHVSLFKAKRLFVPQPQESNNVVNEIECPDCDKKLLEKLGEEFSELKSGSKNTLDNITARTF